MQTQKIVLLGIAALATVTTLASTNTNQLDWIAPHRTVTPAQRDIEMFALKSGYEHEIEKFQKAHKQHFESGSYQAISIAENHRLFIEAPYQALITTWLLETSSTPLEQRLIRAYAPTPDEALIPRKKLLEKINTYNRIKWASGTFQGRKVSFVNGVTTLNPKDPKNDYPVKLRIDRKYVWTINNRDYAMAHSDAVGIIDDEVNGTLGSGSDSARTTWFLGFLNGRLVEACDLGNVYWNNDDLFLFMPSNNRLEILNAKTGEPRFELFLSLWDYEGSSGRTHYFGTIETPIKDENHNCKALVNPPLPKD